MRFTQPGNATDGTDAALCKSEPRTLFYRHEDAPLCSLNHGALLGLRHRTVIDHETGADELALWQEEHLPGFSVPAHSHDCEEVISVLCGQIRAEIGGASIDVGPGESVLIPARLSHGFQVTGDQPVRLLAIFSSANPKIFRIDGTESTPPWQGGTSDHLDAPVNSPG